MTRRAAVTKVWESHFKTDQAARSRTGRRVRLQGQGASIRIRSDGAMRSAPLTISRSIEESRCARINLLQVGQHGELRLRDDTV